MRKDPDMQCSYAARGSVTRTAKTQASQNTTKKHARNTVRLSDWDSKLFHGSADEIGACVADQHKHDINRDQFHDRRFPK